MKKILLGLGALALIVAFIPMFAAFEAHVINVTATIENALAVTPTEISYGTVFPQEKLDRTFDVKFSDSFTAEQTADDVDYVIKQKPKCVLVTAELLPKYGRVTEVEGNFVCEDEVNYDILPLLCPYLSKHEITSEDNLNTPEVNEENDSTGINAFHGLPGPWTPTTTEALAVAGRLAKSESDTLDQWNIDLRVPCFAGTCSQDWDAFVIAQSGNPQINPNDYIQPAANEHKLFGCDLWLEVTGVSRVPLQ